MGMSLGKLFAGVFPENEMRIVMVGLDGTGKTTILHKLKTGETISTDIPTIGFSVESMKYKNTNFTMWEVGGQHRYKIRSLWKHYLFNTRGLMFVVDSVDRDRVEEARDFLYMVLDEDDVCLLVLANKQDVDGGMSASEIADKLLLPPLSHRKWHVQSSCATSGEGLQEGLDWLLNNVQTR